MSDLVEKPSPEALIIQRLEEQWRKLVRSVGGETRLIDAEFSKLVAEYQTGEGRSYHNLTHIGKVDEMLNHYRHLARNFIALKFAGDGHDVVYLPGSQTNEEDSALFMREIMTRLGMPPETIAETERLILLTKDHKSSQDDIDGQLLIDADFAILASDGAAYDAYAQAIWQEYVGSQKVTEEIFRSARANLIEGWLRQERIFLVDEIRNELEPIARQNLERELRTLRSH